MKTYGWYGHRESGQSREIVAAKSGAAAARLAGVKRPSALFNFSETWNLAETLLAMTEPGTVFWRPIDVLVWHKGTQT